MFRRLCGDQAVEILMDSLQNDPEESRTFDGNVGNSAAIVVPPCRLLICIGYVAMYRYTLPAN